MEQKIKGKTITRICTCLALVILIVCSILKWTGILTCVEQSEIIAVSTAVRAFALPIDINMTLDKHKKDNV